MSGKAARAQRGRRQRQRRAWESQERRREAQVRSQPASVAAQKEPPSALPALDPRPNPADAPTATPAHRRTGKGQRAPGQQIACGWCGQPIRIGARGPLPKWCSASCRHRAWEQQRAAQAGVSAVAVHDRYIVAIPNDADGWIDQLQALTAQISYAGEGMLIPYPDLERLGAALDAARAATDVRAHRLHGFLPYRPD